MPTSTKFASSNAVIVTGWATPTNAYADDTSYATAAITSKNTSVSSDFGFAGFTTGDIPDGAIINSVVYELVYKSSVTNSTGAVIGGQCSMGGVLQGNETTWGMSLTDQTVTVTCPTPPTLADLRTAGYLELRVRGWRGSSNTAITWSLDYVKVTVDYSIPSVVSGSLTANATIKKVQSGSVTANAFIKAMQQASLTAEAYVKKTTSGSLTADALFLVTVPASLTADAVIAGAGFPAPSWVSPADGTLINTTPVLVLTIPSVPAGNYHFNIELDTAATFDSANLRSIRTNVSQTGWEYHDGASWQPFPAAGVPNTYAGNQVRYTVQSPLSNATWYRRVRTGK